MVDWPILAQLGLEKKVLGILWIGDWHRAFTYEDLMYRDNTFEVLSTFELDRALVDFYRGGYIRFQLFGEHWSHSYIEFALLSGMYDIDFTSTPQY